ncbi:hypothetical protein RJT09_06660 [Segatella copri]|uniref:hypothetical protein n=1 Tax=Segatella copri TaxID=165179 RepID=UPI0025D43C57|nr:hypothetical protein [Segatella copri]MDV3106146.1 hypothetical protein [Segatella copri]
MKKIKNILALLVVALMGLSLTACSEDDLDTNQYQQGVHLNVYGPQPVMRGGQLRFLGSNLDQISKIQIPGCDDITNIEVVKAGIPSEIKITVPKDGPLVGYLTLVTKTDEEIKTKTQLTYEEPIVFTSFSPASIMPGETLTIEGDYLNLVHMIEFADGVQIPEKDFVSHTRYKIEVVVPEEAQTGKINLFDLDLTTVEDPSVALYNIIESENALNVGTPTITKWSSPRGEAELTGNVTAKMGETITVTGEHFGLVKSVMFTAQDRGTELLVFTTSEDGKTLTFALPEEAPDGDFVLVARSGVEIPVGTLTTVAPSECVVSPSPVKAGASLVITGKDLDVVNSIEMPNVSAEEEIKFIVNPDGTKLIIESVPETAQEGNLVLRMKNGKGVEVPFTLVKPVVTGYDNNTVSAGGALTIKGTDLDLVKKVQFGEGTDVVEVKPAEDGKSITLTVPMNAKSGKPTLTMANGTSVDGLELNIEEAIFCYITEMPDFSNKENIPEAGSTMTVPVKNGDKLESVFINGKKVNHVYAEKTSMLTVAIPKDASSSSKLKLVSSNGEIEYDITVIPAGSITRTLMNGPLDLAGWSANTQGLIAQDALDNIPDGANVVLKVKYTPTADNVQLKGQDGSWGNIDLDNGEAKEHVYQLDANAKEFTLPLSATVIAALKAKSTNWGGLIIFNGTGAIINKIEAEITIPQEKTIWSGTSSIVSWSGDQSLAWGGYDWSTVKPGTIMRIYYSKVTAGAWGCVSLRHGQGWGNLPEPIPGQYDFPDDAGKYEVTLTENVIKDLVDNGGLVITGDNFTFTKITLE